MRNSLNEKNPFKRLNIKKINIGTLKMKNNLNTHFFIEVNS